MVKVNKDVCIGCGACCGIDDEVFEIGEDGLAQVIEDAKIEGHEENIELAIDSCPTGAISNEEKEI